MILTKDEFFDVYRQFRPSADRQEFEIEWAKFQQCKRDHESKMRTN